MDLLEKETRDREIPTGRETLSATPTSQIQHLVLAALEWQEAVVSEVGLSDKIVRIDRASAKLQAALGALPSSFLCVSPEAERSVGEA